MATATTEAEVSSIAGPKAPAAKKAAPARREGRRTVDGAVLSDQNVGQRNR